ncbi:conserved hypothetical protein [Vibrio chagasii]|nr:conserved hypothetical protein [Vibrio chagasii]CAH7075636.1 conserved hypothetical protein [Vibrio chagasii]CAH7167162.1 conserved hypothetical protein [Vibrio chagasii]CAH7198304.1 conserved hypothetical protein [Vibrio chagasii]CAH7199639.1 conserved hypothetical protein [Vibrio chagasii]
MEHHKQYFVTDWKTCGVVKAIKHQAAVEITYTRKRYRLIPSSELNEDTVTHVMSAEYEDIIEHLLERCTTNVDRVLVMNSRPETHHLQIACPN